MKIIVRKKLEDWWTSEEDYKDMSDEQIIELIMEDVCAFLDGATWEIKREKGETK